MKKIILTLFFLVGTSTLFAQEAKFSISPKTFYNTILLNSELEIKTDIDVIFYNENDEEVKKYSYEEIKSQSFKVDLKSLAAGKDYKVKILNKNGVLLFTEKLHKSIKANK
ncbi:hypothetical protein [Pseudofulvibacter geojedonensis]|uniref:Secretion system C-terminal sorting domain-containing protein n=1 Tax=Pseudofulvibacter geojedonensis TaxID=1123758 RepID=A0ABW3I5R9_9FLAO